MAIAAKNHFRITVSNLQSLLHRAPMSAILTEQDYYSRGINTATIITRYIIRSSRSPVSLSPRNSDLRNSDSFYRSRSRTLFLLTLQHHILMSRVTYIIRCMKILYLYFVKRIGSFEIELGDTETSTYVRHFTSAACVAVYAHAYTRARTTSSGHVGALTRGIGRA